MPIQLTEQKPYNLDISSGSLTDFQGNPVNFGSTQETADPFKLNENLEFFKAKKEIDDYLLSKHPASRIKILTGTIGRGMMLFSVKSPVLNIGSNVEIGLTEALSRRISEGQLRGTDSKLAIDFVKMTNKIYQQTGFDISRMTMLKDTGVGGERVLGPTIHAQGPGAVRKVGRVIEDIVFKQLMGAPDVAFSSAHFADSVNLNARKLSGGDLVKGKQIMEDSMRIEPNTPEGKVLRTQGILDAQKATWTDTSWASRVSEGIRKILNDVSGDARVGDFVLPLIKTSANVIATGMDYAGMGIPKALIKTARAFKTGNLKSPEYLRSVSRDVVRSGLGLVGAVVITSLLETDDFMGAYDPARSQIEQLRNSNYNAIRVGNKWISTDWLGPLAVPVTAMMYAKKYGDTGGEKTFQYSKGVVSAVLNIPGISDIYDFVRGQAFKKNQSLEQMTGETTDYITSQLYTRLTPSFLSDSAKAIDPTVRQGGKGISGIIAKIPFLSKILPEKKNIFGEAIEGEPAWSDIMFGARVKTDRENAVIKELIKVSNDTGKGINFTNWDKSSSKTLAQFKEKRGQKIYDVAKILYGQKLKKKLEIVIKAGSYKNLKPEDKLKIINGLDSEVMDEVFKRYGFRYQAPKTKKLPKF